MRQTLVLIPHDFAGLPIFGFGWLLILLAVALAIRIGWALLNGQSRSQFALGQFAITEGLMWGAVAAAIGFVLPLVELTNVNGEPVGMAIRGYGVMLLCGVVSAVAMAGYRASQRGIDPEIIYAIAPWAFIGGIVGARLFYVIQYRERFIGDSVTETIGNMLKFTEGGLVVYGSFIGGGLAVTYYIFRHRLPLLTFGDVIVPCLFIGVFFGRIGCLMNGCCYGGRCEENWASVRFPPTSMVYHEQLKSGELLGLQVDPETRRILAVGDGTLAREAGIKVGSTVDRISYDDTLVASVAADIPAQHVRYGVEAKIDGKPYRWAPDQLPDRALPVYAAQLLSSISSLALCLLLCGLSWFNTREGTVMMIGFASYAVLRFVLELVRVDEAGQFGTNFSISQLVSIVVFALSMIGLVFVYRRTPTAKPLPAQASTG